MNVFFWHFGITGGGGLSACTLLLLLYAVVLLFLCFFHFWCYVPLPFLRCSDTVPGSWVTGMATGVYEISYQQSLKDRFWDLRETVLSGSNVQKNRHVNHTQVLVVDVAVVREFHRRRWTLLNKIWAWFRIFSSVHVWLCSPPAPPPHYSSFTGFVQYYRSWKVVEMRIAGVTKFFWWSLRMITIQWRILVTSGI